MKRWWRKRTPVTSVVVNGTLVAQFVAIELPVGASMEVGLHMYEHVEDGSLLLACIEATTVLGEPEEERT